MRSDRISWMEVILFSLATQVTDAGAGAWYGPYAASDAAGFMDVLKEFVRPLGSVILIFVFDIFKSGIRNPMKSFSFNELLIRLSAKNLAEGGQSVLAQTVSAAREVRGPPKPSAALRPIPEERRQMTQNILLIKD